MKILFITSLVPFPLDNGGKIKTNATLKALSKENEVDMVCFYENENKREACDALSGYCNELKIIHARVTTKCNVGYMMLKAFRSIFSFLPLCVLKFISKHMQREIAELIRKNEYDVVYIDHLQMYCYTKTVKKYNKDVKIILDSHNCETQIMEGHFKKASIGIKKIFLWMEYVKLKRFENYAMSSADKVIVLSEEDKKNIEKNLCKAFECDIIPIGVRKISKSKKDIGYTNCINMLFLGSLTWEPNRAGIVWFVRNVVPKLLQEDIEFTLYIVGKEPGKELVDLTKKHENIHAVGYVDDILEYYDKCDCMIVPLFVGSGQRVKIIEAFSYGMPVITTTIGVEGLNYTDGENVLIADDENSFVKAIKRIKSKDLRMKLSRMSINTYDTFYSENRIGDMIQHSVINCVENKVV